ncbi:MAG: 50S ribosomal protein L11 methyltransferase [Rhizobiales bacterium]|nr:50S ribosomal protein L11 methyltransferase [Hyphomicrobiales bacterium]
MQQPNQWLARIADLSPETAIEISDIFEALEESVVNTPLAAAAFCAGEDADWAVEANFAEKPDPAWIEGLVSDFKTNHGIAPSIQIEEMENRDWVSLSLQNLSPVKAGRFFVHGSHDREKPMSGSISIEIDAGQAFGTGHHATTSGCLAALDRELRHTNFRNCMDLGCGSGVLAIAFAKATKQPVLATDIDPVALEVARQNVKLNRTAREVTCIVADGLENPTVRQSAPFDLVMANILSAPLISLANAMRRCVAPGGILILSGILARQAPKVEASYRAAGFHFKHRSINENWATLILRR